MSGGSYISYRGDDSDTAAALVDRELTAQFGDGLVFLGSRSIPAGAGFANALLGRLRVCTVLLVVMGPRMTTGAGGVTTCRGAPIAAMFHAARKTAAGIDSAPPAARTRGGVDGRGSTVG